MRVLMFGSGGFIGRHVSELLRAKGCEVVDTYRVPGERPGLQVDLLDAATVGAALESVRPEVIVNCAGIVQNNEAAAANPKHTENVLGQVKAHGLSVARIVILGSAAEYGVVGSRETPVSENMPLRAAAPYGMSKVDETAVALKYRSDSELPIVVARVFNPVGIGMPAQQLVPRILGQLQACARGERSDIEVSRLDSVRDYIDIRDLADAIVALSTGHAPKYPVYNVGSGQGTSNGVLVKLMVDTFGLPNTPPIRETLDEPEPNYASVADISRLRSEYDWTPKYQLGQTIKEIIDDARRRQG